MHPSHQHKSRQIIRSFEARALKKRTLLNKIADTLSSLFGTVGFLLINVVFYTFWVLGNSGKIQGFPIVDPYPFLLMTLSLSVEAILLTTIILMSQNRENQRDVLRNELGLQVQLITEREITKILSLIKKMLEEQKKQEDDPELDEMTKQIDTGYIERKLEKELEESENIISKT